MSTIQHVTSSTFDAAIASSKPVLVDFYATWCPPCRMLAPALEELSAELAGRVEIVKVNIDEEPALASRFQIEAVPTLVLFRDGEPSHEVRGFVPKGALRTFLEKVTTGTTAAPSSSNGGVR